jgi:excisionase family DNA binding protein
MAELMTAQQVAKRLHRSRSAIYSLINRKHDPLPGRRIGGSWCIHEKEFWQWFNRQPGSGKGEVVEMFTKSKEAA